jgi:hypothetical protein
MNRVVGHKIFLELCRNAKQASDAMIPHIRSGKIPSSFISK